MQLQTQEVPQYHFVYRITNLVNGKYYIGKHSTDDLEDGYSGSGKYLNNAIKKYGKDNFSREILAFFDTSEEAYVEEGNLIGPEQVEDPNCYNLVGGGRGTSYISKETREKVSAGLKKYFEDPYAREKVSAGLKKYFEDPYAREKDSVAIKEKWLDPEYRENVINGRKKYFEDPTTQEKNRDVQIKRYENPEEHIKQSKCQKKRFEDPKEREKTRVATKKYYEENPDGCKKISDGLKKYYEENPHPTKGRKWYVNQLGERKFEFAEDQELFDLGYKYGRKWCPE